MLGFSPGDYGVIQEGELRGKIRRRKVTKFRLGGENFPR